ncbi:MAG: hypothetical protein DRQ06_05650 [Candidatus Hydrothermota bacterium]|nr:MAG: hypothetical protein DRQ06_05650 [Candidatus Hydrothermae bacterium]
MKKNLSSKERNWRWVIGFLLIIVGQNCGVSWLQGLLDLLGIVVLLEALFGRSFLKKD